MVVGQGGNLMGRGGGAGWFLEAFGVSNRSDNYESMFLVDVKRILSATLTHTQKKAFMAYPLV